MTVNTTIERVASESYGRLLAFLCRLEERGLFRDGLLLPADGAGRERLLSGVAGLLG